MGDSPGAGAGGKGVGRGAVEVENEIGGVGSVGPNVGPDSSPSGPVGVGSDHGVHPLRWRLMLLAGNAQRNNQNWHSGRAAPRDTGAIAPRCTLTDQYRPAEWQVKAQEWAAIGAGLG